MSYQHLLPVPPPPPLTALSIYTRGDHRVTRCRQGSTATLSKTTATFGPFTAKIFSVTAMSHSVCCKKSVLLYAGIAGLYLIDEQNFHKYLQSQICIIAFIKTTHVPQALHFTTYIILYTSQ
jgi:hypothetical protein